MGILAALLMSPAWALDTLDSVLARLRPAGGISIAYQETRHLSLLSEVWRGRGSFYAAADTLLKEQRLPERELMGLKGKRLYYYHPRQQQRQQTELETGASEAFQIAALKALLQGDKSFLQSHYELVFKSDRRGWHLTLLPRQDTPVVNNRLRMHGPAGQTAQQLELLLADGDRVDYTLSPSQQGAPVQQQLRQAWSVLIAALTRLAAWQVKSLFLLATVLLVVLALKTTQIKTDLSAFFIAGDNAEEILLASEMQSGTLSRRLIVSLSNADPAPLASDFVQALLPALQAIPGVTDVWRVDQRRTDFTAIAQHYVPFARATLCAFIFFSLGR